MGEDTLGAKRRVEGEWIVKKRTKDFLYHLIKHCIVIEFSIAIENAIHFKTPMLVNITNSACISFLSVQHIAPHAYKHTLIYFQHVSDHPTGTRINELPTFRFVSLHLP